MSAKEIAATIPNCTYAVDKYENEEIIYDHEGRGMIIVRIGIPGYWKDEEIREGVMKAIKRECRLDVGGDVAGGWMSN